MYRIEVGSRCGCMITWAVLEDLIPTRARAEFALKKWRERMRANTELRITS